MTGMGVSDRSADQERVMELLQGLLRDQPVGALVDFGATIGGEWDRMCVFFEGAPTATVNRELGFPWIDVQSHILDRQWLIFAAPDHVTLHLSLPGQLIYLDLGGKTHCLARPAAVFAIGGSDGEATPPERRYFARVNDPAH